MSSHNKKLGMPKDDDGQDSCLALGNWVGNICMFSVAV